MSRKWLAYLGVPAVALAGVLLVTPTASAQRFGRMGGVGIGFGSGYGYGRGVGFGNGYGYGSPYYGNYYGNNFAGNGYGWNNGYYNNYSHSPAWGSGWNSYPSNYGYTWNSYPSSTYSTYQPAYSYNGQQFASNYNTVPNRGTTSFYPADQSAANVPETAAVINVRVPPDAKITFSDQETKQQGPFRQFVTPALDRGQNYYYMLRVQWNENGQSMDRSRKILVHAGDRINLDVPADMNAAGDATQLPNRSQNGNEGATDPNRPNPLNRNSTETVPAPADRSNLNRDATPGATDNLNRSTNPGGATGTPGTTNPGGASGTTNNPSGTGTTPANRNPSNPGTGNNNPGTNR